MVWTYTFISVGYIPRRGIAGSHGRHWFNFLRTCQSVFQSVCTVFYSHQQVWALHFSPFLSVVGLSYLFDFSDSIWCVYISFIYCSFIYFIYLLFFCEVSVQNFCSVKKNLVVILFWYRPLRAVRSGNIFSLSVTFCFLNDLLRRVKAFNFDEV